MMNRQITQWHNPRDCSAACERVEKVMQKLKALLKSIDEDDEYGRNKQATTPAPVMSLTKELGEFLPCLPMPAHYRFPEALDKSQCRCGKRNGLQDYCGVLGQECYMNPKSVFNSRGQRTPEEQMHSYQNERNKLRCEEFSNFQAIDGPQKATEDSYAPRLACRGKECVHDMCSTPIERTH